MFLEAVKVQILNALLGLFGYMLVLSIGFIFGIVLSSIPVIATSVAIYTTIPLTAIIPMLMIVAKIIKD